MINEHIRYEPDERPPHSLTLAAASQGAVLAVAATVTNIGVLAAAHGGDDGYRAWATFAALAVAGIATALQAAAIGRLGAGYFLLMGAGAPFLAVCVLAIDEGGPALMASLVAAASLMQFAVAAWLAHLRRLITPVVSGVAFMMIALSAIPIAIDRIDDVPDGAGTGAGVAVGAATLGAAALLMLRGTGPWRLWAMPIAIIAGCAAAALLGVYDAGPALDQAWFAPPEFSAWPGFGSVLLQDFWALLIVFLIVSAVVAVKASNEGAVIQQVSRREARRIDFREAQATMNAGGAAILLSGIAGTLPAIAYLPTTIGLINFTGVAARRAGLAIGAMLIGLALLPKAVAVLLTIPAPVFGALLLMLMSMLFVEGMRTALRDGLNPQRGFIVGVSLAIAVGLQSDNVLVGVIGRPWDVALGNSVVIGVLAAVAMTVVLEVTATRRNRLETELDASGFPAVEAYLRELGARIGWDQASSDRLRAAGEETLSAMLELRDDHDGDAPPRLVVIGRPVTGTVELEFMAVFSEENIEERIEYLSDQAETPEVDDISFRLLRHHASSVHHRKYYGIDIVAVVVDRARG